jgi:hypothetical protein
VEDGKVVDEIDEVRTSCRRWMKHGRSVNDGESRTRWMKYGRVVDDGCNMDVFRMMEELSTKKMKYGRVVDDGKIVDEMDEMYTSCGQDVRVVGD